ncbi:hypothetical protein V5799_000656 [Amblyomma americanum]|uniref:Reverse transcriptase domain-containing protein n=1 Tax=Amblyomma americanum TaxID=6943 RepID=A0AAQ4D2F3_AMBAM
MAVGRIGEYRLGTNASWDEYVERLEMFCEANQITKEEQKRAVLLSSCGEEVYGLIVTLVKPERPTAATYEEIKTAVRKHLHPKPSELYARFLFYRRNQAAEESVADYVTALRKLAEDCGFGSAQLPLDVMMRDRFVCGLRNEGVQQRLLAEHSLTFKFAYDLATTAEATAKQQRDIRKHGRYEDGLPGNGTSNPCEARHPSGGVQLLPVQRVGHIAKACRSKDDSRTARKTAYEQKKKGDKSKGVYEMSALFSLGEVNEQEQKFMVQVTIEGQEVPMEVDSGASCSIVLACGYTASKRGGRAFAISRGVSQRPSCFNGPPVHIELKDDAQPVFLKSRPVPLALKDDVANEVDRLVQQGVWEPVSYSNWATPLVVVRKKDGTLRLCGDYRSTVNNAIKSSGYPLPTTAEMLTALSSSKFFTKLDLAQAYQQLTLDDETAEVLTVNTIKGLYKVKRLPFGISVAPWVFQRVIDTLLAGVPGVKAYLDDILISGCNAEEHAERLETVLSRLQKAQLRVNKDKCEFNQTSIEFLGHRIDDSGVHPSRSKTDAIQQAPAPASKKELQAFLGLLNFYSSFLKGRTEAAEPLYRLLDRDHEWKWTGGLNPVDPETDGAFQELYTDYFLANLILNTRLTGMRIDISKGFRSLPLWRGEFEAVHVRPDFLYPLAPEPSVNYGTMGVLAAGKMFDSALQNSSSDDHHEGEVEEKLGECIVSYAKKTLKLELKPEDWKTNIKARWAMETALLATRRSPNFMKRPVFDRFLLVRFGRTYCGEKFRSPLEFATRSSPLFVDAFACHRHPAPDC